MRFVAIALAGALTGCAAAWGGAYNIESETPSAVTVAYDPSFAGPRDIVDVAAKSCARNQRIAVPKEQTMSGWGIVTIAFSCDAPDVAAHDRAAELRNLRLNIAPIPVQQQAADPPPHFALTSQPPSPMPISGMDAVPVPPSPQPPQHCIGQIPVNANVAMPCPQ